MTKKIDIQLLGTPRIRVDTKDVFFSYGKVQALIYYMAVKGIALRDEISGLLWPDKSDANARKNLRNALYEAKKVLGTDIFLMPKNSIIQWNPEYTLTVDVTSFEKDPIQHIDVYKGDFLQGFYLKETEGYEEWYLSERSRLKSLHMNAVYYVVDTAIECQDMPVVQRYIPLMIYYDPYNEERFTKVLRLMMMHGLTEEAGKLYEQLQHMYETDLDEEVPPSLTSSVEESSLQDTHAVISAKEMIPRGREKEAEVIDTYVQQFFCQPKVLRITGDMGSGKTSLLRYMKACVGQSRYIVEGQCFEEEQNLLLYPWTSIVSNLLERLQMHDMKKIDTRRIYEIFPQLDRRISRDLGFMELVDTLPFDVVYKTVSTLLETVASYEPIMLVFEDVQWMDSLSLSLLVSIILHHSHERIMIVITDVEHKSSAYQRSMNSLLQHQRIHMLGLNPLGPRQMRRIAKTLHGNEIDDETIEQLAEVSSGNLLVFYESLQLWKEYGSIYGLTEDMEVLYRKKCDPLNRDEKRLVEFISLFYNEAPLSMIESYMGLDKLKLLHVLEKLEETWFIDYRTNLGEVWYFFRQYKCKEYLRDHIPLDRRQILHAYLGEAWEKRLTHSKEDMMRYKQLEFHFREAGQYEKALTYKLKAFMHYLNFNKDASPELGVGELSSVYANYLTGRVTWQALQEIERDLADIHRIYGDTDEVRSLELPYLYAAGRYYMSVEDEEKGVAYFEELVDESKQQDNPSYTLKAYKELIHYYIQRREVDQIHTWAQAALELAQQRHFQKEIGIILRLQALAFIMEAKAKDAIPLLKESIRRFTVTQTVARRYGINIAAAYNYLGDIHKSRFQLKQALAMYKKALVYCDMGELYSSWIVFASNAGITAFELELYHEAEQYFKKAYELCQTYTITRRLPIVEAYLGLLSQVKGEEQVACAYLQKAQDHVVIMNHPQEVGHVNLAIFLLKVLYRNNWVNKIFQSPANTYGGKAVYHLDGYRDLWERHYIQSMLEWDDYDGVSLQDHLQPS